jgi:hypothetical protein
MNAAGAIALTAALTAAATAFGAWAWTTTRRPTLPARPPLDDQAADYIADIAREVFQP